MRKPPTVEKYPVMAGLWLFSHCYGIALLGWAKPGAMVEMNSAYLSEAS